MAFAPVLERKIDTEENVSSKELFRDNFMTADEKHNSKISYNYAKLINPEFSLNDLIDKNVSVSRIEEVNVAPVQEEVKYEKPYFVENARADADVFRADSIINRKVAVADKIENLSDEEDNEDLRPTPTTIQYQTTNAVKPVEKAKIATQSQTKKFGLTKKDKIVIAVAVTVIIALFVLIIVNSAIISGLNKDVGNLQSALTQAENAYSEALTAKEEYLEETNLLQVVSDFAIENGMSLR